MIFVSLYRLFDGTGSYASRRQQERLNGKGFKTRNFDRRMDEVDFRWESFWDGGNQNNKGAISDKNFKRWTIEISGLDERFCASFMDKFCPSNRYPRMPLQSVDKLSLYVTIATDPNLARDGEVLPISVGAYYINKLEETGLKCSYTKHISPDLDNPSPSMIWTLTEWRS
jgi:hypothetical protein